MQIIADLQLHSKHSRAVSQKMDLEEINKWSIKKGIGLVATGDWQHPLWFRELSSSLKEINDGIYVLKNSDNQTKFFLSSEISCIYSEKEKLRRVHNLIFSPSLTTCEKVIHELTKFGAKLMSDGRPVIGISSKDLLQMLLEIDERVMFIPAHAWTPHFAVFGEKSGFDSLFDCFGELSKYIYAVETGLSCYDKRTDILTNNGWKKFTEVGYKDKIATLNINTNEIEYQKPKKIQQYQYKGKMYYLKTKRADLLVTPNHNLLFSPCDFRKKPSFLLKTAEILFNKSKRFKKDALWIGHNFNYFILPEVRIKHGSRFYSGYRTKKEKKLPIILWLKFFGFWIAEGWTTEGKNGDYAICISNANQLLLSEIKKILEQFGYNTYWDKKTNNTLRVRDFQLFHYLKQFGKCYDKFIPNELKTLSKELLKVLLEYYIKGDGHIYGRSDKGLSATTTSIRLRDDLQEIALKIGISAYYKLDKKKGTLFKSPGQKYQKIYKQRNDSWVVYFIRKNLHTVIPSLMRKSGHTERWINFEGLVFCVSVPNRTVYIRRNGIPLWCGNSDPAMNWQIKELDSRSIVSFSDAHSGPKLGREATVFTNNPSNQSPITNNFSYKDIIDAIKQKADSKLKIGYTIEFFPEEGKYHWSGHRSCNVRYSPEEEKIKGTICPICGKPLTVGVERRVRDLSHRSIKKTDLSYVKNSVGLTFVADKEKKRKPFVSLIPLLEILTELLKSPTKAEREYERLTQVFDKEFEILMKRDYESIEKAGGKELSLAIQKMRERDIFIDPGYDGVFGKVKIFKENENEKKETTQATLF